MSLTLTIDVFSGRPVTNLDNAGATIIDPRTADRGPYTDFCTFMIVMHGHVRIT